jgi:hypothetical protein
MGQDIQGNQCEAGAGLSLVNMVPMLFTLPHLIECDNERPNPARFDDPALLRLKMSFHFLVSVPDRSCELTAR